MGTIFYFFWGFITSVSDLWLLALIIFNFILELFVLTLKFTNFRNQKLFIFTFWSFF